MSSPRIISKLSMLTKRSSAANSLDPMPSLIRAMTFIELSAMYPEQIDAALKDETRDLHKKYLNLLLLFKKIEKNDDATNYKAFEIELSMLIENCRLTDDDLMTAAVNLKSLKIHRIDHNLSLAESIYCNLAVSKSTTTISEAAVFSNLIQSQLNQNKMTEACIHASDILLRLSQLHPNTPETALAVLYATLASVKAKKHDPEATVLYKKAMALWPENNAIALDAGFMLGEMNDKKSLLMSDSILSRLFPERPTLKEIKHNVVAGYCGIIFKPFSPKKNFPHVSDGNVLDSKVGRRSPMGRYG